VSQFLSANALNGLGGNGLAVAQTVSGHNLQVFQGLREGMTSL
jgi:hypothetical protein